MKIFTKGIILLAIAGFLSSFIINNAIAQTKTFNGGTAAWNVDGNWTPSVVPIATDDVIIPQGLSCDIGSAVSAVCNNITIKAGGGLSINSAGNLDVDTDLLLERGNATYPGGQLLVNSAGNLDVNGTITTELFLKYNDSVSGWNPYHYVSQPTAAALADVFLNFWLYGWSETGQAWSALSTGNSLTVGKGYAAYYSTTSDKTVQFTGDFNYNSASIALTKTGAGVNAGANLVGNPYPCAMDWDEANWVSERATNANLLTDAIYVLNSASANSGSGQYATYVAGAGSGTFGLDNIIPAMQGFFVVANAAGTLNFDQNAKTLDLSTTFYKKSKKLSTPKLNLTITNNSSMLYDETIIHIHPQATAGIDYSYDALKLINPNPEIPNVFTSASSNEDLAINTYGTVSNTLAIPIHFISGAAGNYSLLADNVSSFDTDFETLYLEDVPTGNMINLNLNPSHTFYSDTGTFNNRFKLHLKSSTAGIDDFEKQQPAIYSHNEEVYVNGQDLRNSEIMIYDLLGQAVYNGKLTDGLNRISLSVPTGHYIVNVITATSSYTEKVFIK